DEAAHKLMADKDIEIVECTDFVNAFAAVRLREADLLVVPVRNRIVGEIEKPVRLLRESGWRVLDAMPLRVDHVLAGGPDADFDDVVSVRSHPEAIKQCSEFFRE